MLLDQLKVIVGPAGWKTDKAELQPHLTEWRDAVFGDTCIMLLPDNAGAVAEIVKACGAAGVSIVPQGGNTGLCGGAIPDASGEQVLLNLSRMNRIREISAADFSITVDAGCVLANVQKAAREVDRLFPLSLGAEASCEIGGNLSTNAGGVNVIRYGTARDLVLGLEVVLPDGQIWNGLQTLRKDTAGYDLKQLFIGSEGTLGIITAAALKLFPTPGPTTTCLVAFDNVAAANSVLSVMRAAMGDRIEAFELISALALEFVVRHIPDARLPFDEPYPWFALLEVSGRGSAEYLEAALADCMSRKIIIDAVVAKSDAEAGHLWRLRHSVSAAQKRERASIKHDIALPLASLDSFLSRCEAALKQALPAAEPVVFGHIGDGNLHYNVMFPAATGTSELAAMGAQATTLIYDLVAEMGGSFSAEHGIGQVKKKYLEKYKDRVDLELMRTVKNALDPSNILNPGKVI